ncbi:MAG: hypothetical protein V1495_04435 [Pseudomonadota bacterium]
MQGLHQALGVKDVIYALTLEIVFLGACAVFIGLGWSELKKGKDRTRCWFLIGMGGMLALVSLYVTRLLIRG